MPKFPGGHALVVGVGVYDDPSWNNAAVTGTEGEAVYNALIDGTLCAYRKNSVRFLSGNEGKDSATLANVDAALMKLSAVKGAESMVFIYLVGHGAPGDDEDYYFATSDTQFTPANLVKAGTGLSGKRLLELMKAITAQKVLLVINSCHAGQVQPSLGQPGAGAAAGTKHLGAPPPADLIHTLLGAGTGKAVMRACRPAELSYYLEDADLTYFGSALLGGLRSEGVPDGGGYIGVYELYQHI